MIAWRSLDSLKLNEYFTLILQLKENHKFIGNLYFTGNEMPLIQCILRTLSNRKIKIIWKDC